MKYPLSLSRRDLLGRLAAGLSLASLAAADRRAHAAAESASRRAQGATAADIPLLDPNSPPAKAVGYVEDAHAAGAVAQGNTCASCALYQGSYGSTQGECQLFKDRTVKAAGWCKSWAPQM
ncbi:MAG: high-potential iron-sulfur protein [Proteobacteria bacterium]|nr:high-potential iron-sulfur protein [Pseudomonadota bacterium]